MTRINTNVGSLIGRNNLQRANSGLSQALTRLSTGLRINTGKDDPAGLIASENLRSDITSIRKAISNTDRANQVIATADSALGQVSSLLNDIRGLVTESANSGALSDAQIAANQLQVDSSLEALNRIAQTTTFQGRRLLDGSLDFVTSSGNSNFGQLSALKIDQANLGATGAVSVDIDVQTAATKAQVDVGGITPVIAGANSTGSLSFADGAAAATGTVSLPIETTPATAGAGTLGFTVEVTDSTQGTADLAIDAQATGTLTFDTTTGESLTITALEGGNADGVATIAVDLVEDATVAGGVNGAATDFNVTTGNTITVAANFASGTVTSQEIADAIAALGGTNDFVVTGGTANNLAAADDGSYGNILTGGGTQTLALTAVQDGAADGVALSTLGAGNPTVAFQFGQASNTAGFVGNTLTVQLTAATAADATLSDIATAIGNGGDFTVDSSGVTNTSSTIGAAAAAAANSASITANGADATTEARDIVLTTYAAAAQDFNIQINAIASGSIVDANASDGITAGITGSKDTGYVVTIANDATVDLDNLATFLQNQIAEVETATINGTPANDLNLTEGTAVAPAAAVAVTGSQGQVTNDVDITVTATTAAGATGNLGLTFVAGAVVDGAGGVLDRVNIAGDATNGYTVTIDNTENVSYDDIASALATITEINTAAVVGPNGAQNFDTATFNPSSANTALTGGRDAGSDVITVTADDQDVAFDGTITFNTSNLTAGGIDVSVTNGDITVSVDSSSSYSIADIASAINDLDGYTASVTTAEGTGTYEADVPADATAPTIVNLTGGLAGSGGLGADAVIELAGTLGSEVFNLKSGSSLASLVEQINLVSDATGIEAAAGLDGETLEITSTAYGSKSLVDLKVREEGTGGTFSAAGFAQGARSTGTDIVATVNGIAATGSGNELSINTATLDLTTSVTADFTGSAQFSITGGGALFQLGPDVVSNQQARLGITSVNTAALGGVSGSLYQLGTGGTADLTSDPTTAARIVNEAIDQVTSLRGRLGAFQRTTLETNKNALNDTLSNLTEAESSIRDADFAEETANLTRSQILVQSGTRVLAIANQNPQNVLALLG